MSFLGAPSRGLLVSPSVSLLLPCVLLCVSSVFEHVLRASRRVFSPLRVPRCVWETCHVLCLFEIWELDLMRFWITLWCLRWHESFLACLWFEMTWTFELECHSFDFLCVSSLCPCLLDVKWELDVLAWLWLSLCLFVFLVRCHDVKNLSHTLKIFVGCHVVLTCLRSQDTSHRFSHRNWMSRREVFSTSTFLISTLTFLAASASQILRGCGVFEKNSNPHSRSRATAPKNFGKNIC